MARHGVNVAVVFGVLFALGVILALVIVRMTPRPPRRRRRPDRR